MTAADFLIKLERDLASGFLHLLVLAHVERIGPIHGYGLIKAMDDATGNKGLWKEGTVYPLLNQLEKEGLVRSRWGKGASGPRRKY
jgi:PadR family transcriptional regulator, regulatory protein PadR